MKPLFTLVFFLLVTYSFAQVEHFFLPQWEVGEEKSVMITQSEEEFENGTSVKKESKVLDMKLKVLREDKHSYFLQVTYKNVVLEAASDFYEKFGEELESYEDLNLLYEINKKTGVSHLSNWEETRKFIGDGIGQIMTLGEKESPESIGALTLIFNPIMEMMDTQEEMEAYFSDEVSFIFHPFGKKLRANDTLSVVEAGENPFDATDTIEQTTLTYLGETKGNQIEILTSTLIAPEAFVRAMKDMMRKMMSGFGLEDKMIEEKLKEFDEMEFNMDGLTEIHFNTKSTWPTKAIKSATVSAKDPEKGRSKSVMQVIYQIR